jgi:hypothetical protein
MLGGGTGPRYAALECMQCLVDLSEKYRLKCHHVHAWQDAYQANAASYRRATTELRDHRERQ